MKVLFITGSLNQGGAEFQLLQLAKLFKDHRHEVEVFAITDYDFYLPFVKGHHIPYDHLYNDQKKWKRVWLTAKKIKQVQSDLLISFLKVPSQVAVVAAMLSRYKGIHIVGERTAYQQGMYDVFHFNLMRRANAITVNSISKAKYLETKFYKKGKVHFTPNIIDTDYFTFIERPYNTDTTRLGYVGRVSPEKNLLNLIKGVILLKEKGVDVILDIYGDTKHDSYLAEINELIKKYQMQKSIHLKGKSSNVFEVYKNIDVLCLISNYEGFSNVISEALCCGLPVITSNIEENAFLVEHMVNGIVVDHHKPEKIAEGIKTFIDLPVTEKKKISYQNRTKAEHLFEKESIYKQYISIIELLKK